MTAPSVQPRVEPGRARSDGRVVRAVIWLPGLAVAVGAAVATAHGLFEVAVAARVPAAIAWLYPLITDGLALVAYAATAQLHGAAARYAWSVVVLAAGLSGLAQASYLAGGATLDASPSLRFGVGAWPAVAAAVVAHLLYLLAADRPRPPLAPAAVAPAAVTPDAAPVAPAVGSDTRPPRPEPTEAGVQTGVQPPVALPEPVQPALYTALAAELTARSASVDGRPDDSASNASTEDLSDRVEHRPDSADAAAPRDRARAAAVRHAARHGALPTVSELEALAQVSRGTAGAALKALRVHPTPLHAVPDTPDPEPQP